MRDQRRCVSHPHRPTGGVRKSLDSGRGRADRGYGLGSESVAGTRMGTARGPSSVRGAFFGALPIAVLAVDLFEAAHVVKFIDVRGGYGRKSEPIDRIEGGAMILQVHYRNSLEIGRPHAFVDAL